VGAIVIATIIAFGWYKLRINRQRNSTRGFVQNLNQSTDPSGAGDLNAQEKSINADYDVRNATTNLDAEAVPSGRIQYPL
jgi:hypothetical protein